MNTFTRYLFCSLFLFLASSAFSLDPNNPQGPQGPKLYKGDGKDGQKPSEVYVNQNFYTQEPTAPAAPAPQVILPPPTYGQSYVAPPTYHYTQPPGYYNNPNAGYYNYPTSGYNPYGWYIPPPTPAQAFPDQAESNALYWYIQKNR